MWNTHTEVDSGALSIGIDSANDAHAQKTFMRYISQIDTLKFFNGWVVQTQDGIEIQRERFDVTRQGR